MQIHLFEGSDRVLSPMSKKASKKAHQFLRRLGVNIHLGTIVKDYDGEVLTMDSGETMKTKTLYGRQVLPELPLTGLKPIN